MNNYPDFWKIILGDKPVGFLLGFITVGLFCAFVILLISIATRDKESERTPEKFSLRFFLADTWLRILIGALLVIFFVRLEYEFLSGAWMLAAAGGTGFGVQGLTIVAKNFGLLTTNKLSSFIKQKIENKNE